MVTMGRCPIPQPPMAALVKARLRIAGLLFVEAASTAFQGGTEIRAFRFLYEGAVHELRAAATFSVPGGLGERRLYAASSIAMAVAIIWPSSIVWSEKR
jgi:hypothetical protein